MNSLSYDPSMLTNGDHYDPHTILGLHPLDDTQKVIRIWRPDAREIFIELKGNVVSPKLVYPSGLFELPVPKDTTFSDYKVYHTDGSLTYDPYAFWPTIGEVDLYLFGKGTHYNLYGVLGGRLTEHQGVKGVKFALWAPNARRVSLIGDFNHWDGRANPMRSLGSSGIWEIFIPGLEEGAHYKFEIKTQTGQILIKADPYATSSQIRPATASVVASVNSHKWTDDAWMQNKSKRDYKTSPMLVYEVHLGSWKRDSAYFPNYRKLAVMLAEHCLENHFTHVELLPIQEHPLDESWGYQVSGFFAPTSRFGTPEDFQYFVDYLHNQGIGVILDWVPGHFPTDDFSLGRFDGTALYEHMDPKQGLHPHWNTYIFNFGRPEVVNFLICNAIYWLKVMHVDGLRVDAVASMLYLDYGRNEGEWIPNRYGTRENLEAIEFFKHLNSVVKNECPGSLVIAEESTSFPGITQPVEWGGLGFDMKWNMGWMNDTLRYYHVDMLFRHYHQNDLTFGLLYAFSEKFMLVLSHDEVVHGKQSLLSKMPGDLWQKFANLRLLYSYMICQPGKKLLFMGGEIGQWNEWNCKWQLDWDLLKYPLHQGIKNLVKEINQFYLNSRALWEMDFTHEGFEWVDFGDRQNSIISYLRKGKGEYLLCVHNHTPQYHGDYYLPLKNSLEVTEVFNSDAERFGGSGKHCPKPFIWKNENGEGSHGIKIQIAPLATMIFSVKFP
jgi:1,4-alpha-glucan branching enzyme